MIQDIAPHRYDNAFAVRRPPEEGDLLLLIREEKILAELTEEEVLRFPAVEELTETEHFRDSASAEAGGIPGTSAGDDREGGTEVSDGKEKNMSCQMESEVPELLGGDDPDDGRYVWRGYDVVFLFTLDDIAYYSIDDEEQLRSAEAALCASSGNCRWLPGSAMRTAKPGFLAFAGITGVQLWRWRRDHRFCGVCGGRMQASKTERAMVCPSCGAVVYPKISPAVIVAVTEGEKILLTKYAGRTYTRYALIAGFTEIGETIEETVHREVMEEVGVRVKNLRYYKSQPWSFSDTLLMGFFCEVDGADDITLDREELAVGVWMDRADMPDRSDDISLTSEMMEVFRRGLI